MRWRRHQTPLPHSPDCRPQSAQAVLLDSGKETLFEQTRRRVSLSVSLERCDRTNARSRAVLLPSDFRNTFGKPGDSAHQSWDRSRNTLWSVAAKPYSTHQHGGDLSFRSLSKQRRRIHAARDAAISAVSSLPVKIILPGISADRPEHDYGWIEPAEQLTQAGPGVEPIFRTGNSGKNRALTSRSSFGCVGCSGTGLS
jgi:mannose-1-phosphate guanylyltransferase